MQQNKIELREHRCTLCGCTVPPGAGGTIVQVSKCTDLFVYSVCPEHYRRLHLEIGAAVGRRPAALGSG